MDETTTREFDAPLLTLEGKIVWTVAYVPFSAREAYGTNGRVNVTAILDGHAFRATLLPSRNGHYLPFNRAMKDATGKALGDTVHISLAPDTEPRAVEVPDEVRAALAGNAAAAAAFDTLRDYEKREIITHVMSAKSEAARQRRREALVERLLHPRGPSGPPRSEGAE